MCTGSEWAAQLLVHARCADEACARLEGSAAAFQRRSSQEHQVEGVCLYVFLCLCVTLRSKEFKTSSSVLMLIL